MSNGGRQAKVLPYHFVPVESGPRPDDIDVDAFRQAKPAHLGHHRFVDGCRSGRLLCRLTTESPIFVGAERQPAKGDEPAVVEPFELDGRPVIPGSTLRGLVSSIAEAASGSAPRVLDDRVYSFRAAMRGGSLSAIGEVIVEEEEGASRYWLRPVALPTLECDRQGTGRLPGELHEWFDTPRLKVYIENRDCDSMPLATYRADSPRFYGLRLHGSRSWDPGFRLASDPGQHKRGRFLIAQRTVDRARRPRPWDEIPAGERGRYTKGIVRVMQDEADRRDLPGTRWHEIFLPYDPDEAAAWPRFPILPEAVERFHQLADERTTAHRPGTGPVLPYAPIGTLRNPDPRDDDDRTFRLKTGDLVYFRPTADGSAVAVVSLSAIWRERVEDVTTHRAHKAWSFFRAVDNELVPFNNGRTKVTLAEQLFGFVSEGDPDESAERLLALKSRVRFANARLDERDADHPYLDACTLKILDSPKPPSPDLYFLGGERGSMEKSDLSPGAHRPQGRKFYVHQRWRSGTPEEEGPWRTRAPADRKNMKTRVRPLRDGLAFTFHIDFDNLTDRELGLVLYALRPTEEFRHKLGMGKSIGLGSARIDVLGFFEVDRQARYRAGGLFASRYCRVILAEGADPASWPDVYDEEQRAAADGGGGGLLLDELRGEWREAMRPAVCNALERLGEEIFDPDVVSLPLVDGGDSESETFKWFVSNAGQSPDLRANLRPIREHGWPRLPALRPSGGRGGR